MEPTDQWVQLPKIWLTSRPISRLRGSSESVQGSALRFRRRVSAECPSRAGGVPERVELPRATRFEYARNVGILRTVIAVCVIAFVPAAAWAQRVTKVPDGDTLVVEGVGTVHLLGIKSAD